MAKLRLSKKATEAVLASIKHWEKDMLEPLRAGKKIRFKESMDGYRTLHWAGTDKEVPCYAEDCSLCKLFTDGDCSMCPYTRKYGKGCWRGAWGMFYKKRTLKNCEAMIAKLKAILE